MDQHVLAPLSGATYVAWLLRVWREGDHGAWHASLQAIDGGPPIGFADLEQLFAFLADLTAARAEGCLRPADTMYLTFAQTSGSVLPEGP